MSMPAVVPQERPAGSWPQLRATFGAGFGNPSPVTGFPADADVAAGDEVVVWACSPDLPLPQAAMSSAPQTPTTDDVSFDMNVVSLNVQDAYGAAAPRPRAPSGLPSFVPSASTACA